MLPPPSKRTVTPLTPETLLRHQGQMPSSSRGGARKAVVAPRQSKQAPLPLPSVTAGRPQGSMQTVAGGLKPWPDAIAVAKPRSTELPPDHPGVVPFGEDLRGTKGVPRKGV